MDLESAFLESMHERPEDASAWLVLGDWLEERGRAEQAELARLHALLRRPLTDAERRPLEQRARRLLAGGARPRVPTVTNSLGMVFALVPPGIFWMGSHALGRVSHREEAPRHQVEITQAFYLSVFPVTQAQYQRVLGNNPSHFHRLHPRCGGVDTAVLPVESVAYLDIQVFCRELAERIEERMAGRIYRLPTEAEWEYACRAGTSTPYHSGDRLSSDQANFNGYYPDDDGSQPLSPGGARGRTTAVGSYAPNLFGLHDMHGNVWEWCADWYGESYYKNSPPADPSGPSRGQRRVLRGGGWSTCAEMCRSALRGHNTEDARHDYNGFRLALDLTPRYSRRHS
jgi:sulfatase modifying factor 1